MLGRKLWYVVGAYVPPNEQLAVHWIAQALTCGMEGAGKLLVGELNACLAQPRDPQEEYLATIITNHSLSDQAQHFMPRRRYQVEENWTWGVCREGKPISGIGNYILGKGKLDLYKVGIREPRIPKYHRVVLVELIV